MKINEIYYKYPTLGEFESEITQLFVIIESKRLEKKNEYIHLGKKTPYRIKFEDLDLKKYKNKMISVQKALHFKIFEGSLNRDLWFKAVTVGIAGICEMIKDEYRRGFWDLYFQHIGIRNDNYVYNSLLEPGFAEIGIRLIRSGGVGNREFVDSLIAESGIPIYKAKDQVDFFILFWKYFREESNIENLIRSINNRQNLLKRIPIVDRGKFFEICDGIREYVASFALVIEKLVNIFKVLETIDILNKEDLQKALDRAQTTTGIDPLVVVRDKEQLFRIYQRIIQLITPRKLIKLLGKFPKSERINLPDGKVIRNDQYFFKDLLYGKHKINGTDYVCVPTKSYTLDDLLQLEADKIHRDSKSVLLKSYSIIEIKLNGKLRNDLVRQLYFDNRFQGYILFSDIPSASVIRIRTMNTRVSEIIRQDDEFFLSVVIQCIIKNNKPTLFLHFSSIRLASYNLRDEKISLKISNIDSPISTFILDEFGSCSIRDVSYEIPETLMGEQSVYLISENSSEKLQINNQTAENRISIDRVMLFASNSFRIYSINMDDNPIRYGDNSFNLFVEKNIDEKEIKLKNLKPIKVIEGAIHKIISLKWLKKDNSAEIKVKGFYWNFEQPFSLGMQLRKINNKSDGCFQLSEVQGISLTDFELSIYPIPPENIEEELFWNVTINEKVSYQKLYVEGPRGKRANSKVIFEENDLKNLLQPFLDDNSEENYFIELSVCTSDQEFCRVKFWVFPSLRAEKKEFLKEGDQVLVKITTSKYEEPNEILLKDIRGNAVAKFGGSYSESGFHINYKEFRGIIHLKNPQVDIDLCYRPQLQGLYLNNRSTDEINIRTRKFSVSDLNKIDLVILNSQVKYISVNDNVLTYEITRKEDHYIIPFGQIKTEFKKYTNILKVRCENEELEATVCFNSVAMDELEIDEYFLLNYMINGKVSLYGPIGAFIRFDVFFLNNEEELMWRSFRIECNGEYINNYSFQFRVEPEYLLLYGKCRIKVVKVIFNKEESLSSFWDVVLNPQSLQNDSEILSIIESIYKRGELFRAYDFVKKVLESSQLRNPDILTSLVKRIKDDITIKSINSVTRQVSQILEEEYNLKFSLEKPEKL